MEMILATRVVEQRTLRLLMERFRVFLETKTRCFWSQVVVVVPQVELVFVNIKEMAVLVVAFQVHQAHAVLMIVDIVLPDQEVHKTQVETHNLLQSPQDLV